MAEELLKFIEEVGRGIKTSQREKIYKELMGLSEELRKGEFLVASVILAKAGEDLQRSLYESTSRLLKETLLSVKLDEAYRSEIERIVKEIEELQRIRIGRELAEKADEYFNLGAEILLKARGIKERLKDEIAFYVKERIKKAPRLEMEKVIKDSVKEYVKGEVEKIVGREVDVYLEEGTYEVKPIPFEEIELMCNLVAYNCDVKRLSQEMKKTKTDIKKSIQKLESMRLIKREENKVTILPDGFNEIERVIGVPLAELQLNYQKPHAKNKERLLLKLKILKKKNGEYAPGPVLEAYERSK